MLLDLDPFDMKLNIIGAECAPSPKMFVANTEMEVSLLIIIGRAWWGDSEHEAA